MVLKPVFHGFSLILEFVRKNNVSFSPFIVPFLGYPGKIQKNHDFFVIFVITFSDFFKKFSRAYARVVLCELLKTHLFSENGGVGKKLEGGSF